MILDNKKLKLSTPEEQGISSRSIIKFLKDVKAHDVEGVVDLHSFHIIRNDHLIAAGVAEPLSMNRYHRIYSAAKGIIAVGLMKAVEQGYLSLDEKLVDIFPEDVPDEMDDNMKQVTVYHLLTMNSGQEEDPIREMMRGSENWIRTFLETPAVHKPGTRFNYNNAIPHMLVLITAKKVGKDFFDYMYEELLKPMNIPPILCHYNKIGEREPSAVCVSQDTLIKFGYLFRQKGMWNGVQLLKPETVNEMSRFHVPTNGLNRRPYGYGYQLWRISCDGYAFFGGKNNLSAVFDEADMVFACCACNQTDHDYEIYQSFYENVYLNSFGHAIDPDPEGYEELQSLLSNWNLAPDGSDRSSTAKKVSGWTYVLEENLLNCKSVTLSFEEEKNHVAVTVEQVDGMHKLEVGLSGEWPETRDYVLIPVNLGHGNFTDGEDKEINMASGAWKDDKTFVFNGRSFGRIESDRFVFKFRDNRVDIFIRTPPVAVPSVTTNRKLGKYHLTGYTN